MEPSLAVGGHEEHLHADLLGEDIAKIQHHLALHKGSTGKRIRCLRLGVRHHLEVLPLAADALLPSGNLAGELEIVSPETLGADGLGSVILVDVVGQHTVRREIAGYLGNGILDVFDPAGRQTRGFVDIIVCRDDLVLKDIVNGRGIQVVLEALVVVGTLLRQSPAGARLVALDPPPVENGEMHHAVHRSLLTGSSGSLLGTRRVVEPHIHALDHTLCKRDVIAGHEDDLADEAVLLGDLDDLLDEVLAGLVGGMGLSGEDELYRTVGVVDDGVEPVQVGEEQGRALIGREATGEADRQHVVAERLLDGHDLAGRIVHRHHRVGQAPLDIGHKVALELLADSPDLLIGKFVHSVKALLVIVMCLELGAEHLGVQLLPLLRRPGGIVDAVGHVAHMELLGKVSRVHVGEDVLADLAMEHGHAVDVLRDVRGEDAHRELLVDVGRMGLAEGHHGGPVYLEDGRIMAEILAEHTLVESVMAGRDGSVGRKERRCAHDLHGFAELEVFLLDILAKALQADECGMALIAVIHLGIDSEPAQCADTADAEKDLLLQAVLPIAAVELMGNGTVLGKVGLPVCVEEIEVGTADRHLPDAGDDIAPRESHARSHPVALGVKHGLCRDLEEILRLVLGHLVTIGGKLLGEVTEAVQETDGDEVDVHVTRLLEVVAGEDAETTGIYLERGIQTVLHAEICDGRVGPLLLGRHVGVELGHHGVELLKESLILGQGVETLDTHLVKDIHGVVAGLGPHGRVNGLEQGLGAVVPAPPKVFTQSFKSGDPLRKVTGYHDALPRRSVYIETRILHFLFFFDGRILSDPGYNLFDGLRIGFIVKLDLILPESDVSHIPGRGTVAEPPGFVETCDLPHTRGDRIDHLEIIVVVPVHHGDAGVVLAVIVPHPLAEACQRSSERGYAESEALKRGIAPGLIV